MRVDERSLARTVHLATRAELIGQGTGERAGHRDLHALLAGHRADGRRRGVPHLRAPSARPGGTARGTLQERQAAQTTVLGLHTALHVRGGGVREDDQLVPLRRIRVYDPRDADARHHQPSGEHALGHRHPVPVRVQQAGDWQTAARKASGVPPALPRSPARVHLARQSARDEEETDDGRPEALPVHRRCGPTMRPSRSM